MLAANYKTYKEKISAAKSSNSLLADDAVRTLLKAAEGISKRETGPVYDIYMKQKEIELLSKQLRVSTEIFISQTSQWLELINELNNAFNELGDVENAFEFIHRDLQDLCQS